MEIEKTITIVRHGSTEANVTGLWQGRGDNPLNDTGMEDARKIAERLKEENFDVVFHTPLTRTIQTAEAINQHHNAPFEVIESFIEIDVGELEGLEHKTILKKYMTVYEAWLSDSDAVVPGGESFNQVFDRVKQGVEKVLDSPYKNILIVGHAMVNRAILGNLLDMNRMAARKFRMYNGALSRLVVHQTPFGRHIVVDTWNDASHVEK